MPGMYADDGSINVTIAEGSPTTVTVDNGFGHYAADGSTRVTIVAGGGGGLGDGDPIFIADINLVKVIPSTIDTHTSPGNTLTQLGASDAIISSGNTITVPEVTGTYTSGYELTVVDGVVTAIVAV